jgi:ABC-type transporter Mla MlaB component
MNFDLGTSQEKKTLVLKGNLTIEKAAATKVMLQDALNNAQHVELDIESTGEIDLAFLQLLCSAHRTSVTLGKTLLFKGAIPAIFKKSVEDNGYLRGQGCALDSIKTCLWMIK